MLIDPNSNFYLEEYAHILDPPDPKDVAYENVDPEVFIRRMAEISEPREVARDLLLAYFHLGSSPNLHEAEKIRSMSFAGFLGGLTIGGFLKNRDAHVNYQRKHNAAIFEGKFVGNRHFWDTLLYDCIRKGLKTGVGTCLLATSAGFIGYGSTAIRNKLYLPDFLLGFGAIGALSRCWLGMRGVTAGTALGMMAGLFAFAFGKSSELFTGYSVAQMRYLHHKSWLDAREEKHRKHLKISEHILNEQMKEASDTF